MHKYISVRIQGTDIELYKSLEGKLWCYSNPEKMSNLQLQVPSWFITKYPQFFDAEPESKLENGWYLVTEKSLTTCKYHHDGSWYYDLLNGEPKDKSTGDWTVERKL